MLTLGRLVVNYELICSGCRLMEIWICWTLGKSNQGEHELILNERSLKVENLNCE